MRIIAGEFRGRKIKQPTSRKVRPTKDRIREAVFNIIAECVPEASVLDLFAGSGAYGLEALSRGAQRAVFVEKDTGCAGIIKENIKLLGVEGSAKVVTLDVFKSMEGLEKEKERFDLVFADPPYSKNMAKKTLIKVNQYDILNHSGLLIIECHADEKLPDNEGSFCVIKKRTYGNTSVSVYSKK
jgi:16S rRNA (guanine966-N2)-methyltransferase